MQHFDLLGSNAVQKELTAASGQRQRWRGEIAMMITDVFASCEGKVAAIKQRSTTASALQVVREPAEKD
jgi:hypothetical protein